MDDDKAGSELESELDMDDMDETEEDKDSVESDFGEVTKGKEICGSEPHKNRGFFVRIPDRKSVV